MKIRNRSIAIVGVGNILCSDEGVGVYVINRLRELSLPEYVELYDCGTSGIAVLEALDGSKKGVIIDAVSMGGSPGRVYRFSLDEVLSMEDNLFRMVSLHQFDLVSTLKLASYTDVYRLPDDIVIIGVEGKDYSFNVGLSKEVEEAIPLVVEMVLKEIKNFE